MPLRCPIVKWCAPRWRAEHVRRRRRRCRPGASPSSPWRARNAALPVPARKQRSCESALPGDRQPGLGGDRAHLGLGQLAEREAQPRERRGRDARRACRSGPWPDRRRRAAARRRVGARVVAGGERRRRRARRRTRPSRRAARARCSARTGSASPPPRARPGTGRRRRPGTPRAGRA